MTMSTLKEMIDRLNTLRTKSCLIESLKGMISDEDFERRTGASLEAIDGLLVDIDSALLAPVMEEIVMLEEMEIQHGKVEEKSVKIPITKKGQRKRK
jgi:hypothetical protein